LLLLIAVPKLAVAGPAFLVGSLLALPSGVGQQLLLLVGLFAPLEALRRRTDAAAVAAALIFALVHVPLVLDANGGDIAASFANVMLFQAGVGLIACLAFVRHRAVVPIGVAHAMALA
jgi:membrane protease YdiL (CAAX protease family)